jgi:hypothetical protein
MQHISEGAAEFVVVVVRLDVSEATEIAILAANIREYMFLIRSLSNCFTWK